MVSPELPRNSRNSYFGSIKETLARFDKDNELDDPVADIALSIDEVIERNRIVNWGSNTDTQNRMRNEIEDLLFEFKEKNGFEITFEDMDAIMEQCLNIARARRP